MIDVRRLRTEPDAVAAALARKHVDPSEVQRAAALDAELRGLSTTRDERRAEVRALSKDVGAARRDGDATRAEQLAERSRALGTEVADLAARADRVGDELRQLLLRIPNLPDAGAPDGEDEHDNPVIDVVDFDPDGYGPHQRVPHWEIGEQLGILDLERGAKISGSMFAVYRAQGATLARALCQLALDRNADAFEEIRPPSLVRSETLMATGQLPKFADDAYHMERDDLWAVPTAEVPLTSMYRNEVLDEGDLPLRLMAHTPCFRREAGSAGRDTRGLLRVHEFDKVEILAYTTPTQAAAVLDELRARAAALLTLLGLPYRVLDICAGDLGQSHARSFDLEVYAPGCDLWLEVSSISWFSDYQARRGNIRYRGASAKGTELVHTLNGSALAVPRVWAALVETHRQPDGTVLVPEALRPYMRGAERIVAGPAVGR